MKLGIVALAFGAWLVQRQAVLLSWLALGALVAACVCAIGARYLIVGMRARMVPSRLRDGAAAFACVALLAAAAGGVGFGWASAAAKLRLQDRLDPAWEGQDITLTGVIASLTQPFERGVRFELDVEAAVANDAAIAAPRKVLLSWYDGSTPEDLQEIAPIRAGERWRLTVRLRRPHGTANPHAFDYELWLLERGIGATGYVRARGARVRLAPFVLRPAYVIERWREQIRTKFWDSLPAHRYAGVLVALAIGDQRAIESADWETYTRTGVGHLMSISGLHVTMVSGLAGAFVLWAWRRSARLVLSWPAPKAAACTAVLAAAGYTLLTGFAVPAQRTLYMIAAVAVALCLDRMQSSLQVLLIALGVVLLLDPWAVTAPGFWLSFGAVAIILYSGAPDGARHWIVHWGRVQWAITVGLTPLLLVLFQQVSLVAPLANALAIPVVSFVVTPLALLAAIVPGAWLAEAAHAVLGVLMTALDGLAALPGATWQQHAPPPWTALLAVAGMAWLLAPRGTPARYAAPLLLVPMFAVLPPGPAEGTVWVTFLDVGQGLAALVRTSSHTLLYDTGPSYSLEADAGNRVVVPFLRAEGLARLDAMVVTHNDNDHSGGAASVARVIPTSTLWSSLDPSHGVYALVPVRLPCRTGVQWRWDDVVFELLHPPVASYDDPALRPNSRSCVLRVTTAHGAVLLTGDIEAREERALLQRNAPLDATAMLAPHHGSGTSSTAGFLAAVKPLHAIFTVGYRNRFGHPKGDVLARYDAVGATIGRTDRDGAVTVKLTSRGAAIVRFRDEQPRYWH